MQIKQFEIWIANLNPQIGTEPGKLRPVVIVQTNLLNQIPHPSTIICPITSSVKDNAQILRVHLSKSQTNLQQNSDMMMDQIRAIDNERLVKKIGSLSEANIVSFKQNIKIILDLD